MAGSERQSYITSLIQLVIAGALAAGAVGSTAYNAAYKLGVDNLLVQAQKIAAQIAAGGNSLQSISIPGQSSAWLVSMSLQELLIATIEAWNQCQGQNMIIKRTSARYFS